MPTLTDPGLAEKNSKNAEMDAATTSTATPAAPSATKLDMALDDLVTKKSRRPFNKNRRNKPATDKPVGAPGNRPTTSAASGKTNGRNAGSSSAGGAAGRAVVDGATFDIGSKLLVSNLDRKVTESDLKELFGTVGPLKKVALAFDSKGQSQGSAEVNFARKNDALAALKQYENVALDGRKLRLEIASKPISGAASIASRLGPMPKPQEPRGNDRGSGNRGRGQRKPRPAKKTEEMLDADMSTYMKADSNAAAGQDVTMYDA